MLAIVATGCLALGSAAGLVGGLVSCAEQENPADIGRPLSTAEAGRLAAMWLNNYTDERAGLRGTLDRGAEEIRLTGWIDWRRPLVYLNVAGKTPSPLDGLVQAVPAAVAVRPDGPASGGVSGPTTALPTAPTTAPPTRSTPGPTAPAPTTAAATAPAPPLPPPTNDWRVRPFGATGPSGKPLDTMLRLLFTIAATQADAPDLLAASGARWLRADQVDGVPVDVFLGPAVPPRAASAAPANPSPTNPSPTNSSPPPANPSPTKSSPTPAKSSPTPAKSSPAPASAVPGVSTPGALSAQGGPVRYWVDGGGRLRRLEATVGANSPLVLDIGRDDRREIAAIEILGGKKVTPRKVTAEEATTLARLRQRDRATGGGPVAIEVPAPDLNLLTADGWVDWWNRVAYVGVQDADRPAGQTLLRADPAGVSAMAGTNRTLDGKPQLPVPRGAWEHMTWEQRADAPDATDLDQLLSETLALASPYRDDPDELARTAAWLRTDTVGNVPVTVYEVLGTDESGSAMGSGRMRYWVDDGGVLRRLEVRTRVGGFGRLDIDPDGRVPTLGTART